MECELVNLVWGRDDLKPKAKHSACVGFSRWLPELLTVNFQTWILDYKRVIFSGDWWVQDSFFLYFVNGH